MTEYARVVFSACVIAGVLGLFSYGKGRAESLALGIITLFIIASPLSETLGSLPTLPDLPTVDTDGGYTEALEKSYADGLSSAISDRFYIKKEDLGITVSGLDRTTMQPESVRVYLCGNAIFADYRSIEKYVEEITNGKCRVEIEIKKQLP
jgi:hypothetical protein